MIIEFRSYTITINRKHIDIIFPYMHYGISHPLFVHIPFVSVIFSSVSSPLYIRAKVAYWNRRTFPPSLAFVTKHIREPYSLLLLHFHLFSSYKIVFVVNDYWIQIKYYQYESTLTLTFYMCFYSKSHPLFLHPTSSWISSSCIASES